MMKKGSDVKVIGLLFGTLFMLFMCFPDLCIGQSLEEAARLHKEVVALYKQGRYQEAIPIAERVLVIREKILGPEHPQVATSLHNLALLYKLLGDYARAEPLYKRALAIVEKVHGTEHPDVATNLNSLALLYKSLGD